MTLIEKLESRSGALKAGELAVLFDVTAQHIYKMAARGSIPSFRVAGAVRFDPQEVARWLRKKQPGSAASSGISRAA